MREKPGLLLAAFLAAATPAYALEANEIPVGFEERQVVVYDTSAGFGAFLGGEYAEANGFCPSDAEGRTSPSPSKSEILEPLTNAGLTNADLLAFRLGIEVECRRTLNGINNELTTDFRRGTIQIVE